MLRTDVFVLVSVFLFILAFLIMLVATDHVCWGQYNVLTLVTNQILPEREIETITLDWQNDIARYPELLRQEMV